MAVVKADAYGHGAVSVSRVALREGADWLAVANLAEALELRQAGIYAPILVLGHVAPDDLPLAIMHDIRLSLIDLSQVAPFEAAARACGAVIKAHIKVDSGMGRLGMLPRETPDLIHLLRRSASIATEGIFTHFAAAEDSRAFTLQQLAVFKRVVEILRAAGLKFDLTHASNSSAMLNAPDASLNMVRAGILLYGLMPSDLLSRPPGLRPVMSWRTRIIQVKTMPPDSPVGYGMTYQTRGQETIAVLPVGYADGLRRTPQTWREVLVHGKRAPIIGTVNMEKTTINVSHIPGVRAGDEATLLGEQGGDAITADEIARWLDSVNYEVVSTILPRAPRP